MPVPDPGREAPKGPQGESIQTCGPEHPSIDFERVRVSSSDHGLHAGVLGARCRRTTCRAPKTYDQPVALAALERLELRRMHNKDDLHGLPASLREERGVAEVRGGDSPVRRLPRDPSSHGNLHLRRTLVLAERFNALCALKSDPHRLVDLLGSVIANARDSFAAAAGMSTPAPAAEAPTSDQLRCLRDLEGLMRALALGAPEASRGLRHAMDALLIQCVLIEQLASEASANEDRRSPD